MDCCQVAINIHSAIKLPYAFFSASAARLKFSKIAFEKKC